MSLVADYDSDSDENDIESSHQDVQEVKASVQNLLTNSSKSQSTVNKSPAKQTEYLIDKQSENNLFSQLPQKKSKAQIFASSEDGIEDFVPKSKPVKEKQKIKIAIPSLSDFQDDLDEPVEKKLKPSNKGSGLLSLLPPVKGSVKSTKSFVPSILVNKSKISTNSHPKDNLTANSVNKKTPVKQKYLPKKGKESIIKSDTESEDEDIEVPETFDDEMWLKVCSRPKCKPVIREPEPISTESVVDSAPEPDKPYDGLDNEAFKELLGKTKRPIGNIKLIDINEEEILPDKDLWMTKSLTDPEMAPKASIEDPVDPTRRKKHHITYLAQQAKANEQELANAWAASKNSRLASRAKYGF